MQEIFDSLSNFTKTLEYVRLFHGRGGCFHGLETITVDSFGSILKIAFFSEMAEEQDIISLVSQFVDGNCWDTLVVQYRYRANFPSEVLIGELKGNEFTLENGLKYHLNLRSNRNNGFFPDMVKGREYIRQHSASKRVLNLFSYTCSFSVAALAGGAHSVVNIDMSKSALSTGRENHRLNNQDLSKVKFLSYNILKSWNGIKKNGPYDLVIIDPPSFQKGSFVATKDYLKIIQRITQFLAPGGTVLSALNDPALGEKFLIDLYAEHAPDLIFVKRLPNSDQFPTKDEQSSLKNLVFKQRG